MTTETTTTAGSAPTHIAYSVRDGKDKGFWTPIGVAWPHKDGKGFNIQLHCLPVDGEISLRVNDKK